MNRDELIEAARTLNALPLNKMSSAEITKARRILAGVDTPLNKLDVATSLRKFTQFTTDLTLETQQLPMADRLRVAACIADVTRQMQAAAVTKADEPLHTAESYDNELRKIEPDVASLSFADRLKFAAAAHANAPAHVLAKGATACAPGQRAADPTINYDAIVAQRLADATQEILALPTDIGRRARIAQIRGEVREFVDRQRPQIDDHRKPIAQDRLRVGQSEA